MVYLFRCLDPNILNSSGLKFHLFCKLLKVIFWKYILDYVKISKITLHKWEKFFIIVISKDKISSDKIYTSIYSFIRWNSKYTTPFSSSICQSKHSFKIMIKVLQTFLLFQCFCCIMRYKLQQFFKKYTKLCRLTY